MKHLQVFRNRRYLQGFKNVKNDELKALDKLEQAQFDLQQKEKELNNAVKPNIETIAKKAIKEAAEALNKYRSTLTNIVNITLNYGGTNTNVNRTLQKINNEGLLSTYSTLLAKLKYLIRLMNLTNISLNNSLNFNRNVFKKYYTGANKNKFEKYISSLKPNVKITNLNIDGLTPGNASYQTIINSRFVKAENFRPKNVNLKYFENIFSKINTVNGVKAKYNELVKNYPSPSRKILLNQARKDRLALIPRSYKENFNKINTINGVQEKFKELEKNSPNKRLLEQARNARLAKLSLPPFVNSITTQIRPSKKRKSKK